MNVTKIVANTSAILALAAVAIESGKMGVSSADENVTLQGAKDTTRDFIGASKLNYPSPLYSEIKKDIFELKTPNPVMDIIHGVGGYFKGFADGLMHNLPSVGFAAATLFFKSNVLKTIGAIGLGISAAYNFLINGTNLFEKKDYLD